MILYKKIVQLFLSLVALLLIAAPLALAQEGQWAGAEENQIEYSDAQLEEVASAYVAITEIRQELQDDLTEVTDQEQARSLQEQAGADMINAVEETGLAVDKYNEIIEESQVNGNLRNRLMLMINLQQ
jgi:4-amino-4-deoxy-L-arabinose transferase-like glycosyltransferase